MEDKFVLVLDVPVCVKNGTKVSNIREQQVWESLYLTPEMVMYSHFGDAVTLLIFFYKTETMIVLKYTGGDPVPPPGPPDPGAREAFVFITCDGSSVIGPWTYIDASVLPRDVLKILKNLERLYLLFSGWCLSVLAYLVK